MNNVIPNYHNVMSINLNEVTPQEVACGIVKRDLWKDESGAAAYVLEFSAGAVFPKLDRHDEGYEQLFVISGTFSDGKDDYHEGAFIHNPKGSSHIPQSHTGCSVLVIVEKPS